MNTSIIVWYLSTEFFLLSHLVMILRKGSVVFVVCWRRLRYCGEDGIHKTYGNLIELQIFYVLFYLKKYSEYLSFLSLTLTPFFTASSSVIRHLDLISAKTNFVCGRECFRVVLPYFIFWNQYDFKIHDQNPDIVGMLLTDDRGRAELTR